MEKNERFFSVELKNRISLKNVTMTNGGLENVLVEGTLGQLRYAAFSDNVVLEVVGDKGILRINLTQDEIKQSEKERKGGENNMNESKLSVLIAYGTAFGATAGTAEEIAKILRAAGTDVKVANLKEEKIQDVSTYNLVVAGSGMKMGNWTREAEDFLKKFHKDFADKKLALFISSLKPVEEKEGHTVQIARTRKVGLEQKILNYKLNPISTGMFGGIMDYNQMGFLIRKSMEIGYKSLLQKHGFKETAPGVYDLRDWNEIRSWARELAQKALE